MGDTERKYPDDQKPKRKRQSVPSDGAIYQKVSERERQTIGPADVGQMPPGLFDPGGTDVGQGGGGCGDAS